MRVGDLPVVLGHSMLQINVIELQVECWVQSSTNHWKTVIITGIQYLETRLAAIGGLLEVISQEFAHLHLLCHFLTITTQAHTQQLVVLHVGSRSGTRKVERHR